MGYRYAQEQDQPPHGAVTALARGAYGRLPSRYIPAANNPTAVLWPRRLHGNQRGKPALDWSAPLDLNDLQSKIMRPALEAVGLPASRPATTLEGGTPVPATRGVRLHDLRQTAAVLWLTNGVHFIQVAKWLGHSSYVLTLTTYADYIPEQEVENPLPEPVAVVLDTNVVNLFG